MNSSGEEAALRSARGIVVLLNNLDGVFQLSVLQGVGEVAKAHGRSLEARPLRDQGPGEVQRLVMDVLGTAAGVIVLSNALADDDLAVIAASGLPVTLVSHHSDSFELPTTMFDNQQGLAQLMKHVTRDCGRTRPVFIRGDPSQLDGREREQAFRDECVRLGLKVPPENYLEGEFTPQLAGESLEAFIARGDKLDAVVASDYLMAIAAQEAVRAAGLRVPEDVAVVGYGDGPEAEAAGVTTVAADVVELGRRSARQLVAQLSGRPLAGRTLLSTHLVRRSSSC